MGGPNLLPVVGLVGTEVSDGGRDVDAVNVMNLLTGQALNQQEEEEEGNTPEKHSELGFLDLFRSRDILIITIVMFFNWPIITMGYFGLGLSMTQLGGNIFIEFILGAAVEAGDYSTGAQFYISFPDSWLSSLCASY